MASGGPDQSGGSSSEERVQPASTRVQKDFCIKRVYKLMKSVLPRDAQITKKSKQCMVECAAEFISFITSEANYKCQLDQRNSITAEDLIDAMRKVGLNVIADYSFRYNQHYRNYQAGVSGQYYAPPPLMLPQDVQARVSGQYYAPPPPPLPLRDVQGRNFPMAPNFMFSNPIDVGTFIGVDDEVLPPPPLAQDVQARVSGQYYAPPPPLLPSQDVQARNFSMAPNFKFLNPIEMGTFSGGDDGEELPPPLLPQDVQAYVSGQFTPPPPPPPDDQARYFPTTPNFMFPNPIEMGSYFGDDDAEGLPPPPLPQDVQACVNGQYASPPPPLDVQARYFPMAPNFKLPNPIEIGAFFGDDDGEELPPPPLPQDVQAHVSDQYALPPPPLDVQACDFPMAPNFMFPDPKEMGSLFGDGYGEELGGGRGGDGNSNDEEFDLIAFLKSYD